MKKELDLKELNFAVDGDSITAGNQWSYHCFNQLEMKSHVNIGVGSSGWYKKRAVINGEILETQDYSSSEFAGISDGWEPTNDKLELQKRLNNCAVVHLQKYLQEIKDGIHPIPDVFVFAMGTNDEIDCMGDADKALTGKSLVNNENINLFTEAGAMRWCIQKLLEEFPNIRVFVMTPIQTATPERNQKNLKLVNHNFYKIAGALGAQVIDCYHNCGISEKFEVINGYGRYLYDGLHPHALGQALEGSYVAGELKNRLFVLN